jgi:putative hydrolase of the HAD superfamily
MLMGYGTALTWRVRATGCGSGQWVRKRLGTASSGVTPTDAVPPPGPVRAVIFDHGGVVTLPSDRVLATFPDRYGMTLEQFRAAIGRAGARLGSNPMVEIEVGRISQDEFRRQVEPELPAGATLEGFEDGFHEHQEPNQPILELAARLRSAGYRTAVVANSAREWGPLWQGRIPEIGATFDVVLSSCDVGSRKPDPHIYSVLVERLGVPADACLFVDDKDENCTTARSLGMQAVLFKDTEQALGDIHHVLVG